MSKRSQVLTTWECAGLRCAVLAMDMGHLCGYVAVPPEHPWHGRGYDDQVEPIRDPSEEAGDESRLATPCGQIAIHGGLTYAAPRLSGVDENSAWWFGFDCAHSGDRPDPQYMSERFRAIHDDSWFDSTDRIWTLDAVVAETERLAEQLATALPAQSEPTP